METNLHIIRTPYKERLVFNTWRSPFPYLLSRYSVVEDVHEEIGEGLSFVYRNWYNGFFSKRNARNYINEVKE